ncbi:serine/threonine-protein kinase [Kitasatospora sp. NPDC101235]|uniref:serine/threonine-protein kinase n=1 Tax=Kitasatospora sp. NPDC101235 TaxID=3364101 RepID=UPI00382387FB
MDGHEGLIGGRYVIRAAVGQGAMGRVWRAFDPVLNREVALKEILLPGGLTPVERWEVIDRVRREARMVAQLNHPGIVRMYDVIEHQGDPVIVMEYIDGSSLQRLIDNRKQLPAHDVGLLATAVLEALEYMHAAGIVHRDLKPDNILVTTDGRPVLIDFGIARPVEGGTQLTVPGTVLGTTAYMAPELIDGGDLTVAADVWSLGATLYTALEGRPPSKAKR